ncbi:MAG: hypothetical protein HC915_07470, partial [Anaerolineae bacterium]|nr:hypothetical protein [Anaerolineae bacterium]
MSEVQSLIVQAKKAYASRDKEKAKDLLLKAIDLDERNESAWMLMTAVATTLDEQLICLETCCGSTPTTKKPNRPARKSTRSKGARRPRWMPHP